MNPYKRWLGISSGTTNPDYFELLGIDQDEYDKDVIKAAAKLQLAKLQKHRSGRYADACEKITDRIKRASSVLTNPEKRKKYVIRLAEKNGQPVPDVSKINERRFSSLHTDVKNRNTQSDALNEWENQKSKRNNAHSTYKKIAVFVAIAVPLLVCVGLAFYFVQPKGNEIVDLGSGANGPKVNATEPEKATSHANSKKSVSADDASNRTESTTVSKNPKQNTRADSTQRQEDNVNTKAGQFLSNTRKLKSPAQELTKTVEPGIESKIEPVEISAESTNSSSVAKEIKDSEFVVAMDTTRSPSKALAVLEKYCASCHGGGDAEEGGFDFVLNHSSMVAAGYITPGKPGLSLIFERMISAEAPMPPEGEASPTEKEVKTIRDWIRAGAGNFVETKDGEFVSTSQLYKMVADDLQKVKADHRKFIRYFSVQHLTNSGYSDSEIEVHRMALQKLLNSLSWHRKLVEIKAVSGSNSIFRVDLRSLKWRISEWEQIESKYEYAVLHDSTDALKVFTETESEVPVVRGDWFVAQASRPPLYHDLLQLPEKDSVLEQMLQVDIESNLETLDTVRAGFTRSGVSQNNRLIERHDSLFGPYWKSYDFGGNTGRKNLFEFPLGPGESGNDFEHDGGEIIFTLPNGMLAFMLVDQTGARIDKGPTAIVSDPRQPDRAVVNGVSCMSCHYAGYIPKDDEIRGHVLANKGAYASAREVLALYPEQEKFRKTLLSDSQAYLKVLKNIGIESPSRSQEPVVKVANRFGKEVNAAMAAAELGLRNEELVRKIKDIRDLDLVRQVGPLGVTGGMLKRETFGGIYLKLVVEMGLGQRTFATAPNVSKTSVAAPSVQKPMQSDAPIQSSTFGDDSQAAQTALNNAVRLANQRQLDQSVEQFEDAIRLATNLQFRARAYEEALEVFAAKGKIQEIIDGFVVITSELQGTETIVKARQQFIRTLIKFLVSRSSSANSTQGWRSWEHRDRRVSWQIADHEVPLSIANMISKAFENKLKQDPGHEPSLRILETHYSWISKNDKRLYDILLQIRKILNDRGETLDYEATESIVRLYMKNGEPAKAAMIHNRRNSKKWSLPSFRSTYLKEAHAWVAANENQKAIKVLKKAENDILKKNVKVSAYDLERMQAIYESIDQHDRMVPLIKKAIRNGGSKYDIERLQEMLRTSLAKSNENGGSSLASSETEDLLDPKQRFRAQAQHYENKRGTGLSRVGDLTSAAFNWIKAGEKKRANEVLVSAQKNAQSSRTRFEHIAIESIL